MIRIEIPGMEPFEIKYLVMDYNGTLAIGGNLIEGVASRFKTLKETMELHVLTADTFGKAAEQLEKLPVHLHIISQDRQSEQKAQYVRQLGCDSVICIGNGQNDTKMLQACRLSFALIQAEGAAVTTLTSANVVYSSIIDALDSLIYLRRLYATLRV